MEFSLATATIDFRTIGFDDAMSQIGRISDAMRNIGRGNMQPVNDVAEGYSRVAEEAEAVKKVQIEVTQNNGWDEVVGGIHDAVVALVRFRELYKAFHASRMGGESVFGAIIDSIFPKEGAQQVKDKVAAMWGKVGGANPFKNATPQAVAMPAIPMPALPGGTGAAAGGSMAGLASAMVPIAAAVAAIGVATMAISAVVGTIKSFFRAAVDAGGEFAKQWSKAFETIAGVGWAAMGRIGEQFAEAFAPLIPVLTEAFDLVMRFAERIGEILVKWTFIREIVSGLAYILTTILDGIESSLEAMGLLADKTENIKKGGNKVSFVGLEEFGKTLQRQMKEDRGIALAEQQLAELKSINQNTGKRFVRGVTAPFRSAAKAAL